MSANDQRPRGQPSHVSNGSGGKEEEAYLQQQPPHPMRAWGEQPSDGGYGAGPMSTAVSDSFFPNYYPPNMSYPFMSQGMGGSEGAWSSGADTMFGMGYDYSNMYSGFGFPFNNWDYSGDYWGSSQPVRKDQRGYPAEDAYYPPEMIPQDNYGMVNGGAQPPTATVTATATPANAESQEPVVNVERGIRDMRLGYRKDNVIPQQQQQQHPQNQSHQRQQQQQQPQAQAQQQPAPHHHLQHVVAEGFGGEPPFMMPPSPVSATVAASVGGQPSMGVGNNSSSSAGSGDHQTSGQSSSKKTSWAAIASQPARPQLQMRPRTIPRAPVHPGKSHNMDIGTWDTRGNPNRPVPMTMSQPLPNQPPSSIAARYSRQPLIGQRQAMPPPSTASVPVSNSSNNNSTGGSGGSSGAPTNSNLNSSSSYSNSGNNAGQDTSNGAVVNDNSSNVANISSESSGVVASVGGGGADSNNSNSLSNSGSGGASSSSSAYSGGYSSNAQNNAPDSSNNRAVVNVNASMNGIHGNGGDSSSSSQAPAPVADSASSDKALSSSFYNPKEFVLNHKSARYFVIKSYSEDDIHRSIKYSVWCSTDHGNRRLDAAFREREGKGPIYLIFSVNGSGHFCGVAQMMTPVDYNKTTGIWHQDKWKGQIEVKWVYVKDVPNAQLRHIRLENNENKPVTNSRDTQEVPPEKGKQVLRIMHSYKATTSIFDDFSHYEKRQEEDRLLSIHRENRGGHGHNGGGDNRRGGGGGDGGDYHGGNNRDRGDRDHHHQHQQRGGDRDRGDRDNHHNHHRGGGNNSNDHHHHNYNRNDYNRGDRDGGGRDRDNRDHHHQRYDGGRGGDRDRDNRNDNRDRGGPRGGGGFDREIRGRPGSMNDRENRRGGFRQH